MRKIVLQIACLAFCCACVPFPHYETKMPRVSGVVTKNATPLSGATVTISDSRTGGWSCSKDVVATTITDSSGYFYLKAMKDFRVVRTVIGDQYYINPVCIITGETTFLGYVAKGVGYPPESLSVSCRIDSESKPVDEKTFSSSATILQYAICTPLR